VHTAMAFDIFNRHAGKLAMANVAQTINCIHSLFLAQGDKYWRTPATMFSTCTGPTWERAWCR
jgi:alpha-N-arabinofuranosidase